MSDARLLCVFGTGSEVGKSWITAGLCRIFRQAGVDVAPFKAQNISNNAGVTSDGLEMGRAQIVQAHAAGLVPHVDMNPVLLKPNTATGLQVVALGKVLRPEGPPRGLDHRRRLVTGALDRLRSRHALIIAEGAGSCAEVNLRERDLVNMPIAHHGDGAVLLVANIHRGGVFAQLVGSLACMPAEDAARVKGFVINQFHGDPAWFDDGAAWLEARTGRPVLGVVPWAPHIRIPDEDGLAPDIQVDGPPRADPDRLHAAVLRLPHMANFTDLDALVRHGVALHWLTRPRDLSPYDVVVIPGTKDTRGDLSWLHTAGWSTRVQAYQGMIIGLCGGYQMLGESIADPHGVEGSPGTTPGLGLLPVHTTMAPEKTTRRVSGTLGARPIHGYEIHVGQTNVDGPPLLHLGPQSLPEGCRQGRVLGTYVHGLFDSEGVVEDILGPVRPELAWPQAPDHAAWRAAQLDGLAAHLRTHLDLDRLSALAGFPTRPCGDGPGPGR